MSLNPKNSIEKLEYNAPRSYFQNTTYNIANAATKTAAPIPPLTANPAAEFPVCWLVPAELVELVPLLLTVLELTPEVVTGAATDVVYVVP